MIKISKSKKQDSVKFNDLIFTENPHPNSYAGYILLRNSFFYRSERFDEMNKWLDFRHEYLTKKLREQGNLICHYCKKPNLEIGNRESFMLYKNSNNKNIATIDHIEAIGNGGDKYDENNMVISCKKCNTKKGTKSYNEFIKELKNEKYENNNSK
jgi:5-methylcytosine-specific restriction endonuclease McrA